MQVIRHNTAAQFLARTKIWLEGAEAENNLILGISRYFEVSPERPSPYFLTVEKDGTLTGAGLMTPPRNLIITSMHESSLTATADYFLREGIPMPGITGPKPSVRRFAEYWKIRTGKNANLKTSYRLYACERVLIKPYGCGRLRPATRNDEPLATKWAAEFCRDAGIADETDSMTARVPYLIAKGSLYLWEDDQIASMAIVQRETERGISISMVYTPAHLRNYGYATSCVAAVTQRMLDAGKRFCCLYADLTNLTSNSIYQKIGYEPIFDSEDLAFE